MSALYLNAMGPPEPAVLAEIAAHGFDGIRCDLLSPEDVAPALWRLSQATSRLGALWLLPLRPQHQETLDIALRLGQALPAALSAQPGRNHFVEIGNEPDLDPYFRSRPFEAGRVMALAGGIVHGLTGVPVVTGGISNLRSKPLRYLEALLEAGSFGRHWVIGFHRYQTEWPAEKPLPGYFSREEELEALRQVIGHRSAWCTEVGWHTGPQRRNLRGWFRRVQWRDDQVAQHLSDELAIQRRAGIPLTVIYQVSDGPREDPIDRFGRRRLDGTWKPDLRRSAFL